ncbi:tRNA wybutosine-synthesizing protein 4 [Phascolarctos cinereus]|uniref:tRNA wybutosine-synthesizing protein 4 n=1 Tax=Phascolarctos cinereus TaxID=38626 RepID=A0A6P5M9H4_PHACI|nr:tRNA wybutosine-synthesizing protein 4 [Phascolarctos cinereus]
MGPRGRERRAGAVQSTNDSSSLSKCSLAAHGYVRDPFAALLVAGAPRRAPLIHRGYYVRARAVRHCVRAFLESAPAEGGGPRRQILSLGAGSDSLYFRLKAAGRLARAAVWEVDFPDVAERKAARIRASPELAALAGPPLSAADLGLGPDSALRFAGEDYRLLGSDLRDVPALSDALAASGLDVGAPTLLLAEAVLSYLEPGSAAALLAWAAGRFADALFVLYEQMGPHDPFGRVMQRHFERLSSPLHGLASFPDVAAQRRRFLDAGWGACSVLDMNEFYHGFLPAEERRRVQTLEPFDEFEEWHLKCSHYFILVASTAGGPGQAILLPPVDTLPRVEPAPPVGVLSASILGEAEGCDLKRFGHASALLGPDVILSTGGFGEQEGRHARMSKCHVLFRQAGSRWNASHVCGSGAQWDGRLFHTMTSFSDTLVLVLGGRLSPVTPALGMYWLCCPSPEGNGADNLKVTITEVGPGSEFPSPRWRHSAAKVRCQRQTYLFVYGGRNGKDPVLGDWHFLHLDTMTWVSFPVEGPEPDARHSHSACSWKGGALIAGGLSVSEEPLSSVHFLKPVPNGFCWERLEVQPPITPRYSHTAHVFDGKLLLVGGVWIHSSSVPGVTVIDLTTKLSSEYHIDTTCVPWPLMLHNHTSIFLPEEQQLLLLGGGGNCFSFGTHFNPHPVTLDISSLRPRQ